MAVREVLGAVAGLAVILFVLFGLALLVWGVWDLLQGGVRDLLESLKLRRASAEFQRLCRREDEAWAAERDALERERLAFALDEESPVTAAATNGELIATGHRDGSVRLRSLSEEGRITGGFSTNYEEFVRVAAVSADGGLVATGERFRATGELRDADGELLGTIPPGPSEAFRTWDANADDSDGYLHLNEYLEGLVFGRTSEDEPTLTAVWGYRYGPDGGPGPVYGSGALLVRRFLTPESSGTDSGPLAFVSEVVRDLGHYPPNERVSLMTDGSVAIGSGRRVDLLSPGSTDSQTLRDDVGWPLCASPDGQLLLSEIPSAHPESVEPRSGLAVWDSGTGEKLHSWEDDVISFGPAATWSADGTVIAVEARERWSISDDSRGAVSERTYVRIYSVRRGALICRVPAAPILLAFSPTGELLFTVENSDVKAWRV